MCIWEFPIEFNDCNLSYVQHAYTPISLKKKILSQNCEFRNDFIVPENFVQGNIFKECSASAMNSYSD